MKVCMFSTSDSGGAGRAALRLHKALVSRNIDSNLIVKSKESNDYSILEITSKSVNDLLISYIQRKYFAENIYRGNVPMSIMYSGINLDWIKICNNYDIVNFHWISNFISLEAMKVLEEMGMPLFWTLHDRNPMTGACHCLYGCEKYKIDCNDCKQMVKNPYNITRKLLQIKKNYMPRNLVVIAPSKWMAECARESAVFRNHRIEIISNSVDLDVFKPEKKVVAKRRLGINENVKTILFGAERHIQRHKGFKEFVEAIQYAKEMEEFKNLIEKDKIRLLFYGDLSEEINKLNIPFLSFGYVKDDKKLSEIYSAADVFALPSLEDNLPNAMLESIACGTPVVAFKVGGMLDCICNATGVLVDIGDSKAFAIALLRMLFIENLKTTCRIFAEKNFSSDLQSEKYLELYQDVINNQKHKYQISWSSSLKVFPETMLVLAPYLWEANDYLFSLDEVSMNHELYGKKYDLEILEAFIKKFDFFCYKKASIAIFGWGTVGKSFIEIFKKFQKKNINKILGVFDNNIGAEWGKYEISFLDINKIETYNLKLIIITSIDYQIEIYEQIKFLEKKGVLIIKFIDMFKVYKYGMSD